MAILSGQLGMACAFNTLCCGVPALFVQAYSLRFAVITIRHVLKNPRKGSVFCPLYCSSLSFCFYLASFAFSFQKAWFSMLLQEVSKACPAKNQEYSKGNF